MSDPMITTENLLSSTSAPINEPKQKTWKRLVPLPNTLPSQLVSPPNALPSQTHDVHAKDLKRKNSNNNSGYQLS